MGMKFLNGGELGGLAVTFISPDEKVYSSGGWESSAKEIFISNQHLASGRIFSGTACVNKY